ELRTEPVGTDGAGAGLADRAVAGPVRVPDGRLLPASDLAAHRPLSPLSCRQRSGALPVRLYERLAHDLEGLIRDGTLRVGSRAPSIRGLCRERATSPASVVRAYELLEARGLLESRARSGFFGSGPQAQPR